MHKNAPASKVFYRPIEASIRWTGLLRYEQAILASVSEPRNLPTSLGCPRLEELRLYTERIYDGILNQELSFGQNGITLNDLAVLDAPDLTVRHTDLKCWMRTHYPEHRPSFLFCRSERIAHPIITVETGQAMLVERLGRVNTNGRTVYQGRYLLAWKSRPSSSHVLNIAFPPNAATSA